MHRLPTFLMILLVCAFAALVAGCGDDGGDESAEKIAEKMIEDGSGGDVDIESDGDEGKVTLKDEDGTESKLSYGTELPENWPDSVPLPDDAKVTSAQAMGTEGEQSFMALATSEMSVDEITAFYEDELEGFEATNDFSTDQGTTKTFVGNGLNVLLGVAEEDGARAISLTVTPEG